MATAIDVQRALAIGEQLRLLASGAATGKTSAVFSGLSDAGSLAFVLTVKGAHEEVEVTVEDSANGTNGWAEIANFGSISAGAGEYAAVADAPRDFIRVVLTGTVGRAIVSCRCYPGGAASTFAEILAESADADGAKITGLGDPEADQDAATKNYVDDNIAGDGGAVFTNAADKHLAQGADLDLVGNSYIRYAELGKLVVVEFSLSKAASGSAAAPGETIQVASSGLPAFHVDALTGPANGICAVKSGGTTTMKWIAQPVNVEGTIFLGFYDLDTPDTQATTPTLANFATVIGRLMYRKA